MLTDIRRTVSEEQIQEIEASNGLGRMSDYVMDVVVLDLVYTIRQLQLQLEDRNSHGSTQCSHCGEWTEP